MTAMQRANKGVNDLVENSYLKIGTALTLLCASATLIWQGSQLLWRLERLEYQRWNRVSQERWSNDLQRQNPTLSVPDPYAERYAFIPEGGAK